MFYNLILLLPCSACLICAALLFCQRKNNSKSQNILIAHLLFTGIYFFCIINQIGGVTDYSTYYKLDIIDSFVAFLVYPTMYLFIKSLIHKTRFTWKSYMWFLPSLLMGSATLLLYMIIGSENSTYYIESVLINKSITADFNHSIYKAHYFITVLLYNVVLVSQCFITATYAAISTIRYRKKLNDFYSSTDDKSIDINYSVLTWLIFTLIIQLIFIFGGGRSFWEQEQNKIISLLVFGVWGVSYIGLYYFGSRIKHTVANIEHDLSEADREAVENCYEDIPLNETVKKGKYHQLITTLQKHIDEDKVFLRSSLRIDELARLMCTNRTYISRLIKEEYHCTFSDYINRKRIEYSKELMRLNPNIKQYELAEKSGFLSITSYNRVFRQLEGIPPKEWCKNNINN